MTSSFRVCLWENLLGDIYYLTLLEFKRFCGCRLKLEAKVFPPVEGKSSKASGRAISSMAPQRFGLAKAQHLTFQHPLCFKFVFPPPLKSLPEYFGLFFASTIFSLFFCTVLLLAECGFPLPFSSIINVGYSRRGRCLGSMFVLSLTTQATI